MSEYKINDAEGVDNGICARNIEGYPLLYVIPGSEIIFLKLPLKPIGVDRPAGYHELKQHQEGYGRIDHKKDQEGPVQHGAVRSFDG